MLLLLPSSDNTCHRIPEAPFAITSHRQCPHTSQTCVYVAHERLPIISLCTSLLAGVHYTLFTTPTSADQAVWQGEALSPRAAVDTFGAESAEPLTAHALVRCASAVAADTTTIFCDHGHGSAALERALPEAVREIVSKGSKQKSKSVTAAMLRAGAHSDGGTHSSAPAAGPLRALLPMLHRLRWRKSPAEIALLAASTDATAQALRTCMAHTWPGLTEQDLEAHFRFQTTLAGAHGPAFPPVVGSGANACTIHYGRNDARLCDGDLVLLDAGCERWGYASDVTRTWPVSGTFSPAQRAVYEAVLRVHTACVAEVQVGAHLRDIHALSVHMLTDALRDLGVAIGDSARDSRESTRHARKFYPHALGHWLGCDTHDCATVAHDTPLEPGVVLTIEPGLYLQGDGVPDHLQGIGVRIEDDVLVRAEGPKVLSAAAPVDVDEVEALVGTLASDWPRAA